MRLNLRNPLPRALPRRLLSGVTLLAYLVAAIGFPVPQTPAHAANACGQQVCSCQDCKASGCGCSHRPPETPPQETEPAECCSLKPAKAPSPCCAKKSFTAPKPTKTPKNSVQWVVGISALKCRGGATEWVSAGAALPTAAPLTWQPSWPFCYSLPVTHHSCFVLAADLFDPPPRLQAV
jgi:hypothetical protein